MGTEGLGGGDLKRLIIKIFPHKERDMAGNYISLILVVNLKIPQLSS